jgi:hypothetical protein
MLMNRPYVLIVMYSLSVLIFYCGQWEEFHSRVNKHSVGGIFGVTEAQLMGVAFCATHAATNYGSATAVFEDIFDGSGSFFQIVLPNEKTVG